MKLTKQISLLASLLVCTIKGFSTNYTWTGNTSTDWATSTNWSPNGVPNGLDNVTIVTGNNQVYLDQYRTLNNITMNSGTLNLQGYELRIGNAATFNSGTTISNGFLNVYGTATTSFSGASVSAAVSTSSNYTLMYNSTFDSTLYVVKKGFGNSVSKGGNTFNAPVTIIDSTGGFTLGDSLPDVFNSTMTVKTVGGEATLAHRSTGNQFNDKVYFYSTGLARLYCNYYGTAIFKDTIFVNNTSSGGIYFGTSTGTAILDTPSTIKIGTSGFSSGGALKLRNIQRLGNDTISLSILGANLEMENCEIHSPVYITSDNCNFKENRFYAPVNFQIRTYHNYLAGGNYYADEALIEYSNSVTSYLMLGLNMADTFATHATLLNTSGIYRLCNAVFLGEATLKNRDANGSGTTIRYIVSTAGDRVNSKGVQN